MQGHRYHGGVAASTSVTPLSLGTRARLRVRHGWRLGREVVRYGGEHRLWWLAPAIALLLVAAVVLSATSAALPVTVYALF